MKNQILNLTAEELIKEALKNKNVLFLVYYYFKIFLTPIQEDLIRKIVFNEYKKFSISAMTRYGKTFTIAIAMALCLLLYENKTIFFVAPTVEQSMIIRDYLATFIRICPELLEIVDLSISRDEKEDKLITQTKRAHQTFKNGSSYRVFTAFRDAENLMGYGLGTEGGILIIDEACQIKNEAYTKIMRMLGDNPENSMLIELYNPWTKDCRAYDHSLDPEYHRIHIDWRKALKEGRTTQKFIDSQKEEITKLEFDILYESIFPDQAEDAIFNMAKVEECLDKPDFESPWFIISCDVADKGLDKTVIMTGKQSKESRNYIVNEIYSEDISENVNIAGKINSLILENHPLYNKMTVFIDCIGVGTGVLSMVKEFVKNKHLGVNVIGCHFGEKADKSERFSNSKAEKYFKLKDLFEENKISIPKHKILLKELTAMTWKFSSNSKVTIIDPDKSPDFADSLVYFTWGEEEYKGGYMAG